MDFALVAFGALLVVALVIGLGRAVASWRGGWRLFAILVVLALASHAIKVILDLRRDATSHNLWPFEVVIVAGAALVVLFAATLLRQRVLRRR